jgi:predicted site-specific integrase-resolvase
MTIENNWQKQLAKILVDPNYNILIVEHKDRLARFGTNYLEILLKELDKKVEIVLTMAKSITTIFIERLYILPQICYTTMAMRTIDII